MQFVFLIWPILLLPVFVTWLTRPRPVAPTPQRSSALRRPAVTPAAAPSPTVRKPVPQTTATERCRHSPAYRRAAVQAYETMQALEMDEEDDDATSPAVPLQGKDVASSPS
jgi:hypothetical protein